MWLGVFSIIMWLYSTIYNYRKYTITCNCIRLYTIIYNHTQLYTTYIQLYVTHIIIFNYKQLYKNILSYLIWLEITVYNYIQLYIFYISFVYSSYFSLYT